MLQYTNKKVGDYEPLGKVVQTLRALTEELAKLTNSQVLGSPTSSRPATLRGRKGSVSSSSLKKTKQ